MKNLILVGTLLVNSTLALAQPISRTEEYCEFTLAGALGSGGRCSIRLDVGQAPAPWPVSVEKLRDEDDKVILFNSAVDALNYLNGYGWELITVRDDSSDTYYTMRRRIKEQSIGRTSQKNGAKVRGDSDEFEP